MSNLPVAVIGAGPIGLAAAAHLIERGETPIIFEMGDEVAANVRSWQHVRVFSPWQYNIDSAAKSLLSDYGWQAPQDDHLPTGKEIIEEYLEPLAELPDIKDKLHLGTKVVAVGRKNQDKLKDDNRDDLSYTLHVESAEGERQVEVKAVLDATGTWSNPNPLGAGGLPAIGEKAAKDRLYYGIPDVLGAERERFANKRVMVVGAGHSAFQSLLDLANLQVDAPQTQISWALRSEPSAQLFGSPDDALAERGALGQRLSTNIKDGKIEMLTNFRTESVEVKDSGITLKAEDGQEQEVDEVIVVTGAKPDLDMLRELRLDIDSSVESPKVLAPLIDPNLHSCGSVPPHGEAELRQPERNFYIVGNKSYGRAPTFLMMTGYEQVRSVVAALVGDMEAARNVELVLPETGVCKSDNLLSVVNDAADSCCAPTCCS